jgi:hypothetical protein
MAIKTSLFAAATVLTVVSAGSSALADDDGRGVSVGIRSGFSAPLGSVESGKQLSRFTGAVVPIQIDVGYRFLPQLYVGLFAQYGIALPPNDQCQSCSGTVARLGIDAQYYFRPKAFLDPWAGLGVGYEIASITQSGAAADNTTIKAHGLEFFELQAGLDLHAADHIRFGPYVGLSLGQYSSITGESSVQTSTHEWLTAGLRGQFDF